jgi:hypothetical protein
LLSASLVYGHSKAPKSWEEKAHQYFRVIYARAMRGIGIGSSRQQSNETRRTKAQRTGNENTAMTPTSKTTTSTSSLPARATTTGCNDLTRDTLRYRIYSTNGKFAESYFRVIYEPLGGMAHRQPSSHIPSLLFSTIKQKQDIQPQRRHNNNNTNRPPPTTALLHCRLARPKELLYCT